QRGLAAARSIALLSYRGSLAYNATQQDPGDALRRDGHRAATYQQYQGEKFVRRFDAYSYWTITEAFDSHDVGRGRGGVEKALGTIACPALVVGITSDIIIPPVEQQTLAHALPLGEVCLIESDFGHDGFLVENEKLNDIIKPFLERDLTK
ncbi:MAG: homoserine O-acetyltransferase, partial [Alistipes sp.]|nr:homoserine O-acetyltransferase [Alistipes sp.]